MLSVLEQLATEPMLLFKEKINYKLAGSGKRPVLRSSQGFFGI